MSTRAQQQIDHDDSLLRSNDWSYTLRRPSLSRILLLSSAMLNHWRGSPPSRPPAGSRNEDDDRRRRRQFTWSYRQTTENKILAMPHAHKLQIHFPRHAANQGATVGKDEMVPLEEDCISPWVVRGWMLDGIHREHQWGSTIFIRTIWPIGFWPC